MKKAVTLWPRIYLLLEKGICFARPEWRLQRIITWLQKKRSEEEKKKLIMAFKDVQDKFPKVMCVTDLNIWGPVYWYALACASVLEGKEINLEWPVDEIDKSKANFLPPPREEYEALALLSYFLHFNRFSYD